MDFDPIELKVSYIISAVDRRVSNTDPSFLKLLLTNDLEIPSVVTKDISGSNAHFDILRQIHEYYIHYSFDYPYKTLCGFRTIGNMCEVTYHTSLNYVPGFNKDGRIFSIGELQQYNISLEDYYGELFVRSGAKNFG